MRDITKKNLVLHFMHHYACILLYDTQWIRIDTYTVKRTNRLIYESIQVIQFVNRWTGIASKIHVYTCEYTYSTCNTGIYVSIVGVSPIPLPIPPSNSNSYGEIVSIYCTYFPIYRSMKAKEKIEKKVISPKNIRILSSKYT